LLGAHQLIDHDVILPKHIHNEKVMQEYSKDYLYLQAIQFINKVKKGSFGEHSSVLNGISTVEKWQKVSSGMLKMYKAEVMDKFVVMQHFLFGKFLTFEKLE
jgi:serine/threonine-protein phosphatase 2A activator